MEQSNIVVTSLPYLIVLYENCENKTLKNNILKQSEVLNCLTEIIFNLLDNSIVLNKTEKDSLVKFTDDLIILGKKGGSSSRKLKLLRGSRGKELLITVLSITLPLIITSLNNGTKS